MANLDALDRQILEGGGAYPAPLASPDSTAADTFQALEDPQQEPAQGRSTQRLAPRLLSRLQRAGKGGNATGSIPDSTQSSVSAPAVPISPQDAYRRSTPPYRLLALAVIVTGITGAGCYSLYKHSSASNNQTTPATPFASASSPEAVTGTLGAATPVRPASAPADTHLDVQESPLPPEMAGRPMPSVGDLPKPKPDTDQAGKDGEGEGKTRTEAAPVKRNSIMALEEDAATPVPQKSAKPLAQALMRSPPVAPAKDGSKPPEKAKSGDVDAASSATPTSVANAEAKRYGWNGIALLTASGVVIASRADGQREYKVGSKLPDGSTLKFVDSKTGRLSTDRGHYIFTE